MSDLRDILLDVRHRRGELTADVVVEEATPKGSPLHHHFDWDNRVAGPRWRRHQAAQLIRSVKVDFVRGDGTPGRVRQFHVSPHLSEPPKRVYEAVEDIAVNPVAHRALVNQMRRDWATFKARYEHLAEFLELVGGEAAA